MDETDLEIGDLAGDLAKDILKTRSCGVKTVPSPFSGMNPYLEASFIWKEVHNRLIVALANNLGARLRPKYYAAIETRTYLDDESDGVLVDIPDAIVFASPSSEGDSEAKISAGWWNKAPRR